MNLFDGKQRSQEIDLLISSYLETHRPVGTLLIVLIGDNAASQKYINVKIKLCDKLGIKVRFEQIPVTYSDSEIISKTLELFNNRDITGGIVQLPLPRPSLQKILELLPREKDLDLIMSTEDLQNQFLNHGRCTPVVRSTLYFFASALIQDTNLQLEDLSIIKQKLLLQQQSEKKRVYILGKGTLVGKPISTILRLLNFDVTIDENYSNDTKIDSDFLILGTGVPNLVKGDSVSANCHVLDFGISVLDGKVVGDFDINSKTEHLGLVSYSPGGIGPVVVRFLLMNFLGI